MKKTFLAFAALAMMATSASALSFQWATNILKFDGTNLKSDTSVTAYLVYLGSGVSSVESSYSFDSLPSGVGTQVDSKAGTAATSKVSQKFSFDFGTYGNGDSFAMVASYTKDGETYWNISETVYTLSGIADETSSPDAANFTFNNSTASPSSNVSAGGGWTAVPEPNTAALALAGLALLLKRRKA